MRLAVVAAAVLLAGLSGAAATALDERNVRTVPWSFFSLQGEHLGSQVTAEVRIATLPMASEQVGFLPSPKGVPFRNSGPDVLKLSIHIRLDLLGRSPVKLENHVWFDPRDGTPLYLIRTRFGLDDYHQRFRFTREGVFRRQREPGSAAQAAGPPESWSKLKEHFFGYPPGEMCIPVLETSTLMYLLSVTPADMLHALPLLCVFHKRQLHRVSVQNASAESIGFDYLEKKGECETRRSGAAQARKIRIKSRPIGSYRGEVEDFFRDNTELVLSLDGGLPLLARCDLPLIGGVEMKLIEVRYK